MEKWTKGTLYSLKRPPDSDHPEMEAEIRSPGEEADLDLTLKAAGIPIIGGSFDKDQLDEAQAIGETLIERFWPSQAVLGALVSTVAANEGVTIDDLDDEDDEKGKEDPE